MKINFKSDFSLKGKWWIPGKDLDENSGIFGVFKFNKISGIRLTIEGSLFKSESIHKARHHFDVPIIVGYTSEGYNVALYFIQGSESGSTYWLNTIINAEYAVISKYPYLAVEHMSIHNFNFSTNLFSSFLANNYEKLKVNHSANEVQLGYKEQKPFAILKDSNVDVYFYFFYGYKGLYSDDLEFSTRIFLNFDFTNPVPLNDAVTKIKFYKEFFGLFSYENVLFESVNLGAKNADGRLVQFEFICKPVSDDNYSVIAPYNILLDYDDLKDKFSSMFRFWIDNQQIISSGMSLYLQSKNQKSASSVQTFLNLAFANETLHNTYYPDKNSSFSHRLTELITEINPLAGHIYDTDNFCKRVKIQRNFLAHNHSDSQKSGFPEKYYFYFNSALQMIFECNFLRILQLDDKMITLYLKRHYRYEKIKQEKEIIRKELLP